MKWIVALFAAFLVHSCSAQSPQYNYRFKQAETGVPKAPLVILLHGYGSNENDLFSLAPRFPSNMHVISLRAPFSRYERGYFWFDFEFMHPSKWKYNKSQVKKSIEFVSRFIREACRLYEADSSQVFVMGFSQGAIITLELALNYPEMLAGVAALSGGVLPDMNRDIIELKNLPVFIGHGVQDEVLVYKWSVDAVSQLQPKGAEVTFRSYTAGHTIPEAELRDLMLWLKENRRN